jgi:long-chain acyl-CoA synthetase
MRGYNPVEIVDQIRKRRVSVLVSVPKILDVLRGHVRRIDAGARDARPSGRHAAVRWWIYRHVHALFGFKFWAFVVGAAPLDGEIEAFWKELGFVVIQGYGLTETAPIVTLNHPFSTRSGSVGKAIAGVEMKIADDGEILVRGENVTQGYFNAAEETAHAFDGGWFHTGDIGEVDADGFLRITDRKKALFKTAGGKYIAPQPLELGLMKDALIDRAVIVGEGRPYITALIVPDWGAAKQQGLDGPALNAHVQKVVDRENQHLGHWETIKYFTLLTQDFSEETGELSLKLDIKRKVVSEHFSAQIESMYAGKKRPD